MRTLLVFAACMTALCLHSATTEEARQLVREYVELHVSRPPGHNERTNQMYPAIQALDGALRLSLYCEVMAEKFDDPNPKYVELILNRLIHEDTWVGSPVNEEALDLVRRLLQKNLKRGLFLRETGYYLSYKGDARDIDGMPMIEDEQRLAMRVAGTNILSRWQINWGGISFPSVTNTGPQALYVQDILRQYWETIEVEKGGDYNGYRDSAKIPGELITMVVWFDEDGNPVCNVDLAKYGLTMPEIDLPQNVKDEILRRVRSNAETVPLTDSTPHSHGASTVETPCATEQSPPPSRPWLYVGLFSALCTCVTLWLVRKKR